MSDCKVGAGNVQEELLGTLLCQKARTKTIGDIMTSHPKNTGTNLKQLSLLLENGTI